MRECEDEAAVALAAARNWFGGWEVAEEEIEEEISLNSVFTWT